MCCIQSVDPWKISYLLWHLLMGVPTHKQIHFILSDVEKQQILTFKGAIYNLRSVIQTQNCNIYNINEVIIIISTQKYWFIFHK